MEILDTRKMQCCVPFCKTTSRNVMTTAKGTNFHEVPSDHYLRATWLRALSIQEHHLPDPAVVCSQHFLDDDFYETNSCVRQIRSNAIPSTVQMCMICLDTGSKLVLMTKHRLLQEAYDQLTGLSLFQLCRGGNLKQTLCVLCAQRLINFSRFRDLSLRAHSLMTDLVEQHELITLQHKEVMYEAVKHSKFKLTQTTLSANHCDLYINHTDEEQPPAEESVVVKIEDMSESIMISDRLLVKDEYKGDNYKYCVSIDDCSASIKVETHSPDDVNVKVSDKAAVSSTAVAVHVPGVQNVMKSESVTFGCTLCVEDFVEENTYNEHMSKHLKDAGSDTACDASQVCEPRAAVSRSGDSLVLQNKSVYNDAACDASQVCEPRAAVSRSGDSLVLQNKTGSQRLSDEPPPAAGCAQGVVAPLLTRLAPNYQNKVEATEEAGASQRKEQILKTNIGELGNPSSQSGIITYIDVDSIKLDKRPKKPKKVVLDENPRVRTHTAAKLYTCEICNHEFTAKSNLLMHKKLHTGEKPYSCEICNYKCAQKGSLSLHMRTHTGEKPFSCEICNSKFTAKSNLLVHKKIHTGEKPYTCEICNQKFARKLPLILHKRTHTGEKPYSCEMCDYKCIRKPNLSLHMRTHTSEKPFSCDSCNYTSSDKSNLLVHIRTHTGEKPYSCKTCNFRCANKSNLLVHMRTHTGEKLYSCELCSLKFTQKIHLSGHKRTHTGEKPYTCEICNYKCAEKNTLQVHKRIHSGEKPYSCKVCNYKCAQTSSLYKHMKTHTDVKRQD